MVDGAALSSISVQWDVINSLFIGNKAIGWGANPAARGTPGGGSGGAIYNDSTDYNTLIAGTIMHDNSAREGGGAIFYVVDSGHDGPPVMIRSTDNQPVRPRLGAPSTGLRPAEAVLAGSASTALSHPAAGRSEK